MSNANKKQADEEKERERIATVKENNLQKLRDLGINPNKYGFDKFKGFLRLAKANGCKR